MQNKNIYISRETFSRIHYTATAPTGKLEKLKLEISKTKLHQVHSNNNKLNRKL